MTWVTGQATWGTFASELTRVICGETASSGGVTVAPEDRWVRDAPRTITGLSVTSGSTTVTAAAAAFTARDIGFYLSAPQLPLFTTITAVASPTSATVSAAATGTAGDVAGQVFTDCIRPPASQDIPSGDMSNRTGYYASLGTAAMIDANLASASATVVRVTAPFASQPSSASHWICKIVVTTTNSVPGNYSTAGLNYTIVNTDTGAVVSNNLAISVAADGSVTVNFGHTVNVSDPSGVLTQGAVFVRSFSPAYMRGVDWWPVLNQAAGPPVFSVPPPGMEGTDWDITQTEVPQTGGGESSSVSFDRATMLWGLGIKTGVACAGDKYTVSWPIALGKLRMANPGASATGLAAEVGGAARRDTVGAVMRSAGGARIPAWLRAFSTATAATAAFPVAYAMSVTSRGVLIVAGADGSLAGGGKTGTAYYCAYEPTDPAYDVFPMAFNPASIDYSGADPTGTGLFWPGTLSPYWPLRRRQDGSEGSVRDWQTRWMRCEQAIYNGSVNSSGNYYQDLAGTGLSERGTASTVIALSALGMLSNMQSITDHQLATSRQKQPAMDGAFWLYPYLLGEGNWGIGSTAANESRMVRGRMTRHVFIPDDLSNMDLIDAAGVRYLAVKADFAAVGRWRVGTGNLFGAMGIKQI